MLIFRLLRLAFVGITLALVVLIGAVAYLMIDGGAEPPECATPAPEGFERSVRSLAFDARLATYFATSGRLPAADFNIDEAEAGARASSYLEGRTDRVTDMAICFRDGRAQGFARVETVLGGRIGVKAQGTLDLSGEHPRLRLDSANAGPLSAPGFAREALEDAINEELRDIRLTRHLGLAFSEGQAALSLR
jgi:hypothetical protein